MISGMMCRINSGETKIWPLSTLFASTSAVGTLFDCSFTKETGFSGNGKCSLWMNETAKPSISLAPERKPNSILGRTGRSHVLHRAVFVLCGICPATLHIDLIWIPLCQPSAGDHEWRRSSQKQGNGTFRANRSCLLRFVACPRAHRRSAKKWCESGRDQRQSRDQQQDEDQLAKAGFIEMSIKL